MPLSTRRVNPTSDEQQLLVRHLRELRLDFVQKFMKANSIAGRSGTKDDVLDVVERQLRTGNLGWDKLIALLDQHEPNGKQRVRMFKAPAVQNAQFSVAALQTAVSSAGQGVLWNASVPIAAPAQLQLSSVSSPAPNRVVVVAIGRREYRERDRAYEQQMAPLPGREVQVYRFVTVRAWVRAELDTSSGALNVRAVSVPQDSVHRELLEDFIALISTWFPFNIFAGVDLHRAVEDLYDNLRTPGPWDASITTIGLDDVSGIKTTIRSSSASQSIQDGSPQLTGAYDTIRRTGVGSEGVFYFLPSSMNGQPGNPIGDKPVRVVLKAADGRLDFSKPHTTAEIAHVLSRVRVLAG